MVCTLGCHRATSGSRALHSAPAIVSVSTEEPRAAASPEARGAGLWHRAGAVYRSSVGRKYVMALSGLAIVGFVLAHLIGTLKIFLGAEETNAYGEALRALGGHLIPRTHLLWTFRIGLLLAFAVHIHAAFTLDRRNRRAAGPKPMTKQDFAAATYASRTMLWSGVIVGLFIAFHLLDLTWGTTNPEFVAGDAYNNQITSFQNPAIASVYLVGVAALSVHLYHGLWSLFQSLGVATPWLSLDVRRRFAVAGSTLIGLGYASIPLAVLVGVLDHSGPAGL